jgi:hypothetical protein
LSCTSPSERDDALQPTQLPSTGGGIFLFDDFPDESKLEPMTLLRSLLITAILVAPVVTFADSNSEPQSATKSRAAQKTAHKTCTVRFGGSAFPEPCDRVSEIPTTAEPMRIIGTLPRSK